MLLKIHPDNPAERHLKMACECLAKGGIIVYPTDTLYALGCDIFNVKAVEKIARLKSLKAHKANFSFVCYDLSDLSAYCKPISNHKFRILKKALPGPYTFILEASNLVPKILQNNKKTVGIRVPDNLIARNLVKMLGRPIISTSLHTNDEIIPYPTDPEEIYENYKDKVDIVIHGGYGGLIPSTVVDMTQDEITLIREGKGDFESLL